MEATLIHISYHNYFIYDDVSDDKEDLNEFINSSEDKSPGYKQPSIS